MEQHGRSNGIKLNFNGLPDFTSAGTKTLNVRVGNLSAGIVLQFETSHIIEIKAKDNTERTDLYPYTLADSSFFTDKVIARFNDGMWDETNPLTGYTVEGSLAPTKDDIDLQATNILGEDIVGTMLYRIGMLKLDFGRRKRI